MTTQTKQIRIPDNEIRFDAVRAGGPGGQNVNKVSSAIHLRFDIKASSLPAAVKEKIASLKDRRISKDGFIVIKAQRFRTREKNREDALQRLELLISKALISPRKRKPTRPSLSSKKRRLESKNRKSRIKKLRKKVSDYE